MGRRPHSVTIMWLLTKMSWLSRPDAYRYFRWAYTDIRQRGCAACARWGVVPIAMMWLLTKAYGYILIIFCLFQSANAPLPKPAADANQTEELIHVYFSGGLFETVGLDFKKKKKKFFGICVTTNKHECQTGVSSRLRGPDAKTARDKGCAEPRNRRQIFSIFVVVSLFTVSVSYLSNLSQGIVHARACYVRD